MSIIDQALDSASVDLRSIGRIAVMIGPGSFTGIRVGVATARGLALSLGVECVGVTTLEVLAFDHRARHPSAAAVVVAMDAKREEIYTQAFSAEGDPLTDAAALSATEVDHLVASLAADMTGSWAARLAGENEPKDRFDIGATARIGAARAAGSGRPKPLYLRGPDARPQAGFALPRV